MNVRFVSLLDKRYGDQLKELFFFNPMQGRYREKISEVIDEYGTPHIEECESGIRIITDKLPDIQNLYALIGSLDRARVVGALLYYRFVPDTIQILHMAVHQAASPRGESAALSLVGEVSRIARQISGLAFIHLPYSSKKIHICILANMGLH